jgi:hypothetical protein
MFAIRVAAVSVLIAAVGTTAAADWKTHTFAADGFAADFTGTVDTLPMDVNKAKRDRLVRATVYTQMNDGGTVGFLVGANRFVDGGAINVSSIARRTMKSYACKELVHDDRIDVNGTSAREMHATKCFKGTSIGARFFKRDQWLYQVIYLIQDEADRADGERFMTSFKLVPIKD